jgi:CRP-like cAMP-binding protein
MPADIIAYLRRCRPFQVLPDAELTVLAALARCEVHRHGELNLDLTAVLERFYIVLRGGVALYRLAPDGHKLTVDTKREGAVFWVHSRESKSSVEVLSNGTLLCHFAMREIRRLMLTHAAFAVALFDDLTQVTVRVADRLGEWVHGTVVVRLAHTLATCALANEQRMVSETHDQLAWLAGASRPTVTKELQRLRAEGLIAFRPHQHGIHVPDPKRLLTL